MGQMRVLVVRLGGLWCFSLRLSDPGLLPDRSAPVSLFPGARGWGASCVWYVQARMSLLLLHAQVSVARHSSLASAGWLGGNFKIFCSSLRSALGRGSLPWIFRFVLRSRQLDRIRFRAALLRLIYFLIFLAPSRGLPFWSGSCSLESCNHCSLLLSVRI